MFDLNKLKGRVIEKGLTLQQLAPRINVSEGTIYAKFSGKCEFKRNEIELLCKILDIPISEIGEYFF